MLNEDRIEIEAKKFSSHLGFTCVSIVGGHSIEEQAYNMREVSISAYDLASRRLNGIQGS